MTEEASKAPNHWPLLDFLRATAALLVLFAHTHDFCFLNSGVVAQPGPLLKLYYFITELGHEAVVIFFFLSGFLIGGSLTDSMQRGSFVWFLGAGSYRILRAGFVPLPVGLLGAGLIIAGMAISRLKAASELETDTIIAAGTAIAIACRPMAKFPLAPRLLGWAAGFSYTLYAIHAPLVYLIVAIFQNIGFPQDKVPPSPAAFMEFGVTIAICLLAAFLVSLVSERKTGQVRAGMMRM
jgi:peptidoglycan/LPS O-acetylase OafA/YrhL